MVDFILWRIKLQTDAIKTGIERRGLPPSFAPRGLRRTDAALYLGISPSKFDQVRQAGKVPPPKELAGVKLWCRHELDAMFDELPTIAANDNNEWDTVLLRRTLQ